MMSRKNSNDVLKNMIDILKESLGELADYKDTDGQQFQYGEKVAYVECLEMIIEWELADENGLDFDIEDKFPL